MYVQSDEKIPARSRFFDAKFDGFWLFSQKVLRIQKRYIPHLKALISSFYEPEAQGTWPAHMMATSSRMKLKLFSLKRAWLSHELATPLDRLAHRNCISGLSNEVYNVFVRQLVLEIRAVKVERSKKNPFY